MRTMLAVVVMAALPIGLAAQEPRLAGRLDSAARGEIEALLDSARAASLPVEPLVDRALEGATKGASTERIVLAVRRLFGNLRVAREALGSAATEAELSAGAAALATGAGSGDLARLRAARPRRPVTVPLTVLAELVSRGVPADSAAAAVVALAALDDRAYLAFRRDVERDIALGAPPGTAASVRVNSTLRSGMASLDGSGGSPPPAPRKP